MQAAAFVKKVWSFRQLPRFGFRALELFTRRGNPIGVPHTFRQRAPQQLAGANVLTSGWRARTACNANHL
jgi:hypothetical protein